MSDACNPVLVEVMRGGVLESFHRGVICVVDKTGEVIFSRGNIQQVCYPRSAMKFVQVLPLLEKNAIQHFGFTLEEVAVMCGSHNGEPDHLRVVRSILAKAGLDESYLECGAQYPSSKKESDELIRNNEPALPVHNNCSGKHAGMLALAVVLGVDPKGYINPSHPVQQLILKAVEEMYEYPAAKMVTALDGCSAPIYSIPVYNQALAYSNLAQTGKHGNARRDACLLVIEAVSTFPFMVAGSKRYCTDMMEVCADRVIGKTGAEGVYCLAFREHGIGACIKIDDGKMQPQYNVAQALIEATGMFSRDELSRLEPYKTTLIRNFNRLHTGETRTKPGLFDGLKWPV
jgi:L-asparaginase II